MRAFLALWAMLVCSAAVDGEEAKPVPQGPSAITIHEEQVVAAPVTIADGKLALKTDPPRLIPLDELAKVDFGNAAVLVARWLGQDNHDLAQAKTEAGASGV